MVTKQIKTMRILLMGDASNYHRTLAGGLRSLGHEVTVASAGSGWMRTDRDIDLSRPCGGKLGGALLWAKARRLLPRLSGYDVVQIVSPNFLELRPHRIRSVFDELRARNGAVFLTALGNDSRYVEFAGDPSRLRYSEWQVGGAPTRHAVEAAQTRREWLGEELRLHDNYIYSNIDGIGTALYEYHACCREMRDAPDLQYCGIPVDTATVERTCCLDVPSKVRIFVGVQRGRMAEKGTDRMLAAAQEVVARHPDKSELVVVENRPYDEYIALMTSSHVMLDQLYSYTPATNALLAMARGMTVLSGAEPEYYDFIGEHENHPIVNALPDDEALRRQIEEVVMHSDRLPQTGTQGRKFVMKHNDSQVVAKRFLELWQRNLKC